MEEIYSLLLSTIGLSFREGRLYDEDKDALLLFKGKYIVEDEKYVMRKNSILFDPIMNRGLIQYLFQVYIDKETEEQNLYLMSYQVVPEIVTKDRSMLVRRKLLMILGNGEQVETKFYYLEGLAYIEAIFTATGMIPQMIPDLEKYDNKELLVVK